MDTHFLNTNTSTSVFSVHANTLILLKTKKIYLTLYAKVDSYKR